MLYKDFRLDNQKISSPKVACVRCDSYDSEDVRKAVLTAISLIDLPLPLTAEDTLLIKPNLCLAEPPEKAITTHPEVVKQIALWSQGGGSDIVIGDSPVGEADRHRLNEIWEKTGLSRAMSGLSYRKTFFESELIEYTATVNGADYKYYMAKELTGFTKIINAPKLKTHSLMTYTGAVKNLYGLLPGDSKKKLHSQITDKSGFAALLVNLYLKIRPYVNILDAVLCLAGDGPGAAGKPHLVKLIMASQDALALDLAAAKIMKVNPLSIPTNRFAVAEGLIREEEIEIVGEPLAQFIQSDFEMPHTERYDDDVTKKMFDIIRPTVRIDPDKCIMCGLCVANCPTKCIKNVGNKAVPTKADCISCFMCHEICPQAAVVISESQVYKQMKERKEQNGNHAKNNQ